MLDTSLPADTCTLQHISPPSVCRIRCASCAPCSDLCLDGKIVRRKVPEGPFPLLPSMDPVSIV